MSRMCLRVVKCLGADIARLCQRKAFPKKVLEFNPSNSRAGTLGVATLSDLRIQVRAHGHGACELRVLASLIRARCQSPPGMLANVVVLTTRLCTTSELNQTCSTKIVKEWCGGGGKVVEHCAPKCSAALAEALPAAP